MTEGEQADVMSTADDVSKTEGSRREIRCSSNLLLHCPSASCSWGMVVKNRGLCPRFDTFLNQTPFFVCSVLNLSPAALAH